MPEEPAQPILEVIGVSAAFGERRVLDQIDLSIRPGEIYALLGANGAGKSTILNVVLGLHRPSAGQVRVSGIDVQRDAEAARKQLAYVPENVALYEHLSAEEYLQYMLALSGVRRELSDLHAVLDRVGMPASARSARAGSYSKGMRQKVALALAIARNAPLLLMDEPASGLDPVASGELNRILRVLRDDGAAILLVTHDLPSAAEFADRVGLLKHGRISEEIGGAGAALSLPLLVQRYGAAP
jgi:ABC-2 type transport system ATP-binding protein